MAARAPGLRDTLLAYYAACERLQDSTHRGFSLNLGLDEDFFTGKLARSTSTLRLLHYLAGLEGGAGELGAGEHTGYGNLIIPATDGVAGLQGRQRDGVWLDAPHIEGTFQHRGVAQKTGIEAQQQQDGEQHEACHTEVARRRSS